jgi:gamma-glutamylcyclotransferase
VETNLLQFLERERQDGSGKCDMELTDNVIDRVEGVLFWIDQSEKAALDEAEGLGRGYVELAIDVVTPEDTMGALAYVAGIDATDPSRRPYRWYKAFVIAGAIQHALPADYTARLRAVQSPDDPLPRRRTRLEAEALLAASGIRVGLEAARLDFGQL